MNNIEFDNKIKELVDSCSESAPKDLWDGIEKGLVRRKRITFISRVSYVAVAASIVAVLMILPQNKKTGSEIRLTEYPSITANIPQIDNPSINKLSVIPSSKKLTASDDNSSVYYSSVEVVEEKEAVSSHNDKSTAVKDKSTAVKDKSTAITLEEQLQGNDYFALLEDENDVKNGRRLPVSFGIASNIMAANASSSDFSIPQYAPGNSSISNYGITPISEPSYFFPMTFGVQVQFLFTKRLSVGIGANYTLLHSEYQALIDNSFQGVVKQNLHYIGIPLSLYFNVLKNDYLTFYVAAGGMYEKGVQSKCSIKDLFNAVTYRTEPIQGSQWSANVGLGLEYRFIKSLGIYLDPSVAYFFDGNQPFSIRTSQPLQFKLELGFRFHL